MSSGEKEAASAALRASLRSKTSAEELTGCSSSCSGGPTAKVDPEAPVNTRRRKTPAVGGRAARQNPAELMVGRVRERKKKVELQ